MAVIGAGLGGLALGQLLQDASNVQITVYERDLGMDSLSGYRIMMSHFVLKRLHAAVPEEIWKRIALSLGVSPKDGHDLTFMKSSGQQMFSFDAEEMKDSSSVSRWLLRNALLHKSSRFVKFGKAFQRYEKLSNGAVNVVFDDGSAEEFDLLVGADGVGSRVRNQLLPSSRVSDSDVAVIYFKIPLTPDTKDLLPAPSAVMAFTQNSQNIMVHSWINPRKPWATKFDDYEIAPDDSFIMFGYGSPVDEFLNKKKPPGKLLPEELKEECIARVRLIPNADPKFLALAESCVINTAYVHVVRDCQAVKRWDTSPVTLIGDAVFNISTMLGKGANCAILDALDLAEKLRTPNATLSLTLRFELQKCAAENVKRRLRERQRGALIQSLVYFGDNKLKEFCRERGLKMAIGWIDDPRATIFHSRD